MLVSVKSIFSNSFEFSLMEHFITSNVIKMVEPLVECIMSDVPSKIQINI